MVNYSINKIDNDKKPNKKKNKYKKRIIYVVGAFLLLCSLALLLSCIGKELHLPFNFYAQWDDVKFVDSANKASNNVYSSHKPPESQYSVVIDNNAQRINVLDKNNLVFAQNKISGTDTNIDKITSVAIKDKSIYLSAITWNSTGKSIEKEAIYKTNLYGEVEEILYNVDKDQNQNIPHINSIKIVEENLVFCYVNLNQIIAYQIGLDGSDFSQLSSINTKSDVFMAYYNKNSDKFLYTNYLGNYVITNNIGQIIKSSNNTFNINCYNMYLSDSDNALIYDSISKKVYTIDENNKLKIVDNYNDLTNYFELVYDLNNENLSEKSIYIDSSGYPIYLGNCTSFCLFYIIKIIARWLAVVYVAFLFAFVIFKFINKQRKLYRKGLMRQTSVALCIFLTIVGVVCYYQYYMGQKIYDDYYTIIEQQVNISADSVKNVTQDDISLFCNLESTIYNSADLDEEKIKYYASLLSNLYSSLFDVPEVQINSLEETNTNVFYMAYCYNKQTDNFVLAYTSDKSYQNNIVADDTISNYLKSANNSCLTRMSSEDENGPYISVAKNFYDEGGNLLGAYVYGIYNKYIDNAYIHSSINLLQTLIIICLVFYVVVLELFNMSKVLRKFKKKTKKSKPKAYLQLIRPMNFFLALSMGADSVLAVLISKDLIEKSEFYSFFNELSLINFFAGIPITVSCVCLVCGIALFIKLERYFSSKRIFIVSACFLVMSYIIAARSCFINSFLLLVISKALSGFFSGILRSLLYSMAASEKNEKKRKPLMQSISRSTMPGTVLSVLVCGFLSASYDYFSVYLFASTSAFIFIFIGMLCIPKNIFLLEQNQKRVFINNKNYTSFRDVTNDKMLTNKIIKWLLSPQILVLIICVIVPYTAAKGYKSYFFPLYSTQAGMSSTDVSTIFAIATMVAFILIHPVSDMMSSLQNRQKIINGLLAMGFIFVLFLVNSRVEWAIVVMFVSMLIGRTFGTAFRLSWMRVAEYDSYDVAQLQPYMYFIEEVCNAMQILFFSIFSLFGSNFACVAFGIFCLISAVVYTIVSHNSPMRNEWVQEQKQI